MAGNQIMELLYNYIFKRKSFHLFRNNKTKELMWTPCQGHVKKTGEGY